MDEVEAKCMQAHAVSGIGLRSIFHVSADWMSKILHVNADLILSSCLKLELNKCAVIALLQLPPVCDRQFSAVVRW